MNPVYRESGVLGWYVGGPCYRHQMHSATAQMLASLAVGISRRGDALLGLDFEHTSLLPQGRARLLWRAMDSEADVLVTMDSDTWMLDVHRLLEATVLAVMGSELWSMLAVLVPQTDGRVNAWQAEGERLEEPLLGIPVPLHAVGAALVVHNLAWYRQNMPSLGEVAQSYAMVPTGNADAFVGEDVWHSNSVRRRGGVIWGIRYSKVFHARAV